MSQEPVEMDEKGMTFRLEDGETLWVGHEVPYEQRERILEDFERGDLRAVGGYGTGVQVPKYVSVSLTPEARDALKAYASEQSVTLSEALTKLTEIRVGRVVVVSAKAQRYDNALDQAREAAKLSGGVLLDEEPATAEVGVVSINGEDADLEQYGLMSLTYRMVKLP